MRSALLMSAPGRDESGRLIREVGIMAVVEEGRLIRINDPIVIVYPLKPNQLIENGVAMISQAKMNAFSLLLRPPYSAMRAGGVRDWNGP